MWLEIQNFPQPSLLPDHPPTQGRSRAPTPTHPPGRVKVELKVDYPLWCSGTPAASGDGDGNGEKGGLGDWEGDASGDGDPAGDPFRAEPAPVPAGPPQVRPSKG